MSEEQTMRRVNTETWTPIRDGLPPLGAHVLVTMRGVRVTSGMLCPGGWRFGTYLGAFANHVDAVSAWRDLPFPPESSD